MAAKIADLVLAGVVSPNACPRVDYSCLTGRARMRVWLLIGLLAEGKQPT